MSDEVLVVGDLLVDVVVVPEGPLQPGSDMTSRITTGGGGSAANTACWLATSGRAVALVAAMGDDALGRAALDELTASGVRFAGMVDPSRPTGSCVVLVDPTGERTMLPDRGANDGLTPEAVTAALEGGVQWLHLSGYALLGEGSRAAGLAATEWARSSGARWSVDASSAAPLRSVGPTRFLEWIEGCSVLLANDDELAVLGGRAAVAGRVGALVTKHSAAGATWEDGTRTWQTRSVAIAVVDSVGAGDAFDAGIIDAVLRGVEPAGALQVGAELAAQALGRTGARP